jgi:glucose/mannose transport system substrate-binding protein
LLELISYDGELWSVPVNIHRSNVLWYNKRIFDTFGLSPPTTLDEFFAVADTLQAGGVTPLGFNVQSAAHTLPFFESVLVATMGPDKYRGLWNGTTDWRGPEVTAALETFSRIMDYISEDNPSQAQDWYVVAQLIADGRVAMTIMGDWMNGYYTGIGLTPGVEYGWAPSPGTGGIFIMASDTFVLGKNAANRENAIAWLALCGSRPAQDIFNPGKGSISARTDPDRSRYDAYLQSAMDDFGSNRILLSMAHGAAAPADWHRLFRKATERFVFERDIAATQEEMAQVCQVTGVCP